MLFSLTLIITIIKDPNIILILIYITLIVLVVVVHFTCHRRVQPLDFTFKDLIPVVTIG